MNNFRDLEWRRATAVVFMATGLGCSFLVDVCRQWREPPTEAAVALLMASVIGAIFFLAWMHGAVSNLRALGQPIADFSPWSCVGWWFVPFANLIKPAQAMKAIWRSSQSSGSSQAALQAIDRWWACWLLGGLLGNVSARMDRGTPLILASVTSTLLLAMALHLVARTMRNIQEHQGNLQLQAIDGAAAQHTCAYRSLGGPSSATRVTRASEFPLVVANEEGGAFEFDCPFCHERLHLRQIAFRDIIACPYEFCAREFRVATHNQIKRAARKEQEYQRSVAAEVSRLRQTGESPPDRISVFGITNAGKSVFLASLYTYLWNGVRDISARAKHGLDHQSLLADYAMLARGQWIASTTRTRSFDLALQYKNVKVTLSSLDYPGEVFTDVLYRKLQETPEQIKLYSQLQSTMAAIVLVDPEQVAGIGGIERRLDVEYTGIEIAEHMCSRGIGDNIVIVLTKRNRSAALVRSYGGPEQFLERFLPRLLEAAPTAPILHISSIGVTTNATGQTIPTVTAFDSEQVVLPLLSVLERIDPAYLRLLQQLDQDAVEAANANEVAARRRGGLQSDAGEIEGAIARP